MKPHRHQVHRGWTKIEGGGEPPCAPTQNLTRKEITTETDPLLLDCPDSGLTLLLLKQIEDWISQVVPYPGNCFQLLIWYGNDRALNRQPLRLRIPHERAKMSGEQLKRVDAGFRSYRYQSQPVRLSIIVRQIVRLA